MRMLESMQLMEKQASSELGKKINKRKEMRRKAVRERKWGF